MKKYSTESFCFNITWKVNNMNTYIINFSSTSIIVIAMHAPKYLVTTLYIRFCNYNSKLKQILQLLILLWLQCIYNYLTENKTTLKFWFLVISLTWIVNSVDNSLRFFALALCRCSVLLFQIKSLFTHSYLWLQFCFM